MGHKSHLLLPTECKTWRSPKSRSLVRFDVWMKSFGYIPSTKILTFKGTLMLNISDKHFKTSFQKLLIFGRSHRQWSKVPFSSKHFELTSGILADIWWSLTGVILINHLYWSNLNLQKANEGCTVLVGFPRRQRGAYPSHVASLCVTRWTWLSCYSTNLAYTSNNITRLGYRRFWHINAAAFFQN